MGEPVHWRPDGTPYSARFDDIYRNAYDGLAQARDVFLRGCELPQAWGRAAQWRILETGFGLGLNFLAAWQAWREDPQRPRILHFVSVEAWPVSADDLLRSVASWPELAPLATELADAWWGLVPGWHRLSFEGGRVLLTLGIGDARDLLRLQDFSADSIFLDGFAPASNPDLWSLPLFKSIVRLSRRGTRIASWTSVGEVRRNLGLCGFQVSRADGLAPKRHRLAGVYDPPWQPRGERRSDGMQPSRAVVVGAGLAGASVAAVLALRGWQVEVLDAEPSPARGASGLPAGLLVPPLSPDDNLLSRLARAGLRLTVAEVQARLRDGADFALAGVLERRAAHAGTGLPDDVWGSAWGCASPHAQRLPELFGEPRGQPCWHDKAGWIKPGALVQAWLAQTGVNFRGGCPVARIDATSQGWCARDARGAVLAQAPLLIVCAAQGSASLLPAFGGAPLPLQPVRGQVSWGWNAPQGALAVPVFNGNGHFMPDVPHQDGERRGSAWFIGATYGRGESGCEPRPQDHRANLDRIAALAPTVADHLRPGFEQSQVQAWAGVRCASRDRRPLVGALAPGLWSSVALGSRGLTFAMLCAQRLAAHLHDEPLPAGSALDKALGFERLSRPRRGRESASDPAGCQAARRSL